MSHVTMHNRIPDVIGALMQQQGTLPTQTTYNVVQRTKDAIPAGTWQPALQASVYLASDDGSTYQEAARDYSDLVVTTMRDLVARGLADLTYHNLNELAAPLPPRQPDAGALVTSCANLDLLNQVGVDPIGSTFWDDIAAQVDTEEVVPANQFQEAITHG